MIVQLEHFVTALLEYIDLLCMLFKLISWAVSTVCLHLLSICFKAILQKKLKASRYHSSVFISVTFKCILLITNIIDMGTDTDIDINIGASLVCTVYVHVIHTWVTCMLNKRSRWLYRMERSWHSFKFFTTRRTSLLISAAFVRSVWPENPATIIYVLHTM